MLDKLPTEILTLIVKHLDFSSALQLRATSKWLYEIVANNTDDIVINDLRKHLTIFEIKILALCKKHDNIYHLPQNNKLALYYVIGFQSNDPISKFCLHWCANNEYIITNRFSDSIKHEILGYLNGIDITSYCSYIITTEEDKYLPTNFEHCLLMLTSDINGTNIVLNDKTLLPIIFNSIIWQQTTSEFTYQKISSLGGIIFQKYGDVIPYLLLIGGSPARSIQCVLAFTQQFNVNPDLLPGIDITYGQYEEIYNKIFTDLD